MSCENHDQAGTSSGAGNLAGGLPGKISVGENRTLVELEADVIGEDWLLRITGGQAHVGAVATADDGQVQLSVIGSHKEGPLAEICAGQWSLLTGRVCVAVVGIHQDQATRDEIDSIVDHVRQGLEILSSRWKEAHRVGKDDDPVV